MSHLICTECGGDTHREDADSVGLYTQKDIVCNHCDAAGEMLHAGGQNPKTLKISGPFAELSAEGMQTLRENKNFVPVYDR